LPQPALPPVPPDARRRRAKASLLVWHDFVPDRKQVWFDTTAAEFDRQLDALAKTGARPVSLDALYAYLATGKNPPPPGACVLCFDDNTAGIAGIALPRLRERNWLAAVSAHTKYVGVTTGKAHNDWDALRAMEATGLVRVVSQTHTHPPDLRALSDRDLRREMWESKIRMEEEMGRTARFLTYPSGKWDRRVALAAAAAGYRLGLTEDHGYAEDSPHLMGLCRFSTHRRWSEVLAAVARSARQR
jgi:peptidoglycan/xylan/chitin deacetylase (PgdA/CDA1 family)